MNLLNNDLTQIGIPRYIRDAIIINFIVLGILVLAEYYLKQVPRNYESIFIEVDSLVRAVFMLFSSILISKTIINDLRNKEKTELQRKIVVKIINITLTIFFSIVVSNIFLEISFYTINQNLNLINEELTTGLIFKNLLTLLIYAVTSTLTSLIPMYIGVLSKSRILTIIASFIPIRILCADENNGFFLNSILVLPICLSILGILTTYLAIKSIKNTTV